MMQAMNTGHDGSMTTTHANSARDAFSRLETMVMMASQHIPDKVIRQMLSSAVHLVVHIARLTDGSRRVMNISEVAGIEHNQVLMTDIFTFERSGNQSAWKNIGEIRRDGQQARMPRPLKSLRHPSLPVHLSRSSGGKIGLQTCFSMFLLIAFLIFTGALFAAAYLRLHNPAAPKTPSSLPPASARSEPATGARSKKGLHGPGPQRTARLVRVPKRISCPGWASCAASSNTSSRRISISRADVFILCIILRLRFCHLYFS